MLKRTALHALVMSAIGLLGSTHVVRAASPEVVGDDRDQYTLLYRHPVNRQLFEQLAAPESAYRLGPREGFITALSDVTMGTQQVGNGTQSRYHGWFTADTYIGVRSVYGIDINLNLMMLNPSASDGYRVSGSVHPGLSLHLYQRLFSLDRSPVLFDILGTDLGWVTTGNGLMLESTPLEGVLGMARWKTWELKYMFAGRAYWGDDDYETFSVSALKGRVQANFVNWQKADPPSGTIPVAPGYEYTTAPSYPGGHAYYGTLATRLPIGDWFRLATEVGYRVQKQPRVGGLGRADVIVRDTKEYAVHVGYQFRYYQAGFGPRDRLITPTWAYNTPLQQDAYVTNPFEYLGLSHGFDQWSHTVMGEGRVRLGWGLEAYANTELLIRYARAGSVPKVVVYASNGSRAPGRTTNLYYQTGLRMYPWTKYPHRASFSLSNKQVFAGWDVSESVTRRFEPGTYFLLMGEVFL
jgi:hypothetical protein